MSAATGLEVRVHEGRERAEVTRVTQTLTEVIASLHEIDRMHLLHGRRPTWVVAHMARDHQDLIIRVEARHVPDGRDYADMLVPAVALVAGAEVLKERPEVPKLFTPNTVTRVGKLAVPRDGVQSVSLATYNGVAGPEVTLTDSVKTHADAAVKPFEVAFGTVTGHLTTLTDRKRQGVVRVGIRTTGNLIVTGFVPGTLVDQLRELWRHRVSVLGKIRRNARGQALRVDIEHIEQLPEDNTLRPSTEALLGAGADWLEGLTVDEFMEQIRG